MLHHRAYLLDSSASSSPGVGWYNRERSRRRRRLDRIGIHLPDKLNSHRTDTLRDIMSSNDSFFSQIDSGFQEDSPGIPTALSQQQADPQWHDGNEPMQHRLKERRPAICDTGLRPLKVSKSAEVLTNGYRSADLTGKPETKLTAAQNVPCVNNLSHVSSMQCSPNIHNGLLDDCLDQLGITQQET